MPPRHTYWTILFGDKPTAFRAATQEELLPTFGQIKAKHPDAIMMWFARGKLWKSEEEGRAAFDRRRESPPFAGQRDKPRDNNRPRDDRGPRPEWRDKPRHDDRPRDERPPRGGEGGGWQNRDRSQPGGGPPPRDFRGPKPEWRDQTKPLGAPKPRSGEGRPWRDKPKPPGGPWRDKPRDDNRPRDERPPRSGEGGDWRDKPRQDFRGPKPAWRDKPKPPWRDRPRDENRSRDDRPSPPAGPPKPRGGEGEWQNRDRPKPGGGPPRDSRGPKPPGDTGERRNRDWRPGGEHKDPRDRFKVPRDVKRARFKAQARRDRTTPRPPFKKKKDEE